MLCTFAPVTEPAINGSRIPFSITIKILGVVLDTSLILYTVSQKMGATLTMAITLSILDRFAIFFHCCKAQ